ncbi:MAG: hypothetical protein SF051_14560 [Elusimicrobiota bacterium]|nr:hypothetical protein [Elusimicrobiota bacterium]
MRLPASLVLLLSSVPASAAAPVRALPRVPAALAGVAVPLSAPKLESEIRVSLAESGYLKLAAALPALAADEVRRDGYFDYFDGGRFVLKRLEPPYKVRVKERGDDARAQVSRPGARETVDDGRLAATVTAVESRETRLPSETGRRLSAALDGFEAALTGSGPLEAAASAAGRLMGEAAWEGRAEVEAAAATPGARLLPAARNEKTRRKVAVTLDDGTTLKAVLGVTRALDENGRSVVLYELEADTKESDPEALRTLARRLLAALRRAGLGPDDIAGRSPDAFLYTESRLRGAAP